MRSLLYGAVILVVAAWDLNLEPLPPLDISLGFSDNGAADRNNEPRFNLRSAPRAVFPQRSPDVCLAFLSCCNRTDLLAATLEAAVRHMEEDEPDIAYEVAWVDNGSGGATRLAERIAVLVEHVKLSPSNRGLAWGLNSLFFELCQAPFILVLEEDWLFLDKTVAPQVTGHFWPCEDTLKL